MKILHTPNRFFPDMGGVERYVADLARWQVKHGHSVVVFANSKKHDDYVFEGVVVRFFSYIFSIAHTRISFSYVWHLLFEKFDVLHAHLPTPWTADFSVFIAKMRRKRVVLTYHNHIVGRGLAGFVAEIYSRFFLPILLMLCDEIIVTTQEYADELVSFKDKVLVIPCFISHVPATEKTTFGVSDTKVFGFLSVLDEFHDYKNLEGLLEGFSRMTDDFVLKVAGRGSRLDYFKAKARALGLEKKVVFLGFVPEKELGNYYLSLDYFVLPSNDKTREGFGIVAVEALSYGVPVIASDIVGVSSEIEKNHAGFVVHNVEMLGDSLQKVFSFSNEEHKDMSKAARNLAMKYTVDIQGVEIQKLYEA